MTSRPNNNIIIKKINKKKTAWIKPKKAENSIKTSFVGQDFSANLEKVQLIVNVYSFIRNDLKVNCLVKSLVSRTLQESLIELAQEETESGERFVC